MINELEKMMDLSLNESHLVFESMRYSLLSDGKRVRPMMLLNLMADLGVDHRKGLHAAVALEMVHTYSLVHDDLPAMDNDEYRRHRLTNHMVYGEGMAILAGDGLLTESFHELSLLDSKYIGLCLEVLSRNAGARGMILGQELDIKDSFDDLNSLTQAYLLKTGCLFAAALEMAVVIADRDDLQDLAREVGYKLGIIFQYQDDILEATSSFDTLGKSVDSDVERAKNTIVGFLGVDEAKDYTNKLFDEIRSMIHELAGNDSALEGMVDTMFGRAF